MPDLGLRIKNRRLELGLTLEEVGKKVGVSKGTVQRWESNVIKEMRRDKLLALSRALHTTVDYIMGLSDDVIPSDAHMLTAFESQLMREEYREKVFESLLDLAGFNEALDEDANVTIYKDRITVNQTPELIERVMKQVIAYFTFLLSQEQ